MVEFKKDENKLECVFNGRMDTENCLNDEQKINTEVSNVSQVVFNLEEVDYISSAFLRICIKTSKSVGKDNFKITNVMPTVKKVFKISGLDNLLNIE